MSARRATLLLSVVGFGIAAVIVPWQRQAPAAAPAFTVQKQLANAIPDSTFASIVSSISEPGGYFDTDNLISNESSYLHVMGRLESMRVRGGAYIGVGPEQNFSYMVAVRPEIVFIIDIRRDNLLEHLMFKALFEEAATRVEYVAMLFGREPPSDPASWADRTITDLVQFLDRTPPDRARFEDAQRRVLANVRGSGLPLSDEDIATIARIHATFFDGGPELRYNSHGRPPRASYPTYRDLMLETDRAGRRANYLATEDGYRFLRELELRNRVIPVVGDFAGSHALRAIGTWLREHGLVTSTFYLSNVEFYLWQDRSFDRFAGNVLTLPIDDRSVMIRSLFGRIYGHPQAVNGYNSTQLLQTTRSFLDEWKAGGYATYGDLVYKRYVDLR